MAGSSGGNGEGVTDDTVDRDDWVTEGGRVDQADLADAANVVGGLLTFDDGSTIPVDALTPTGAARRGAWFRIARTQGAQACLAEVMVIGTLAH